MNQLVKVAVAQKPPVLLNLQASIASAIETIEEAAAQGAKLVMFSETFLPGYPDWCWNLTAGGSEDRALGNAIHAKLQANSVDLSTHDLQPIQDAAANLGLVVGMGMNEIDNTFSGSTLYNTYVIIGDDGSILNRHRKLIPTNPERMVWGCGDASGLRVVDTPFGRIGSLICWENYMPLSRFALYSQAIDIYLAPTWDRGDRWIASMRHIAKEGGCWVLSSSTAIKGSDVPLDFLGRDRLFKDDEWVNPGDAVIVQPGGDVVAGPMHKKTDILYAEIDIAASRIARKDMDVSGHYNRPDIFKLEVDRRPLPPVNFINE